MTFYLCLAVVTVCGFFVSAKIEHAHKEMLDNDGRFSVSWTLSEDLADIDILVTAQATGWLGFGISPNGGMLGADIVMAWFDEAGTPFVSDRHAESTAVPLVDASQDIDVIEFSRANGVMSLHFRRSLAACDVDDLDIVGTSRVIYAFSDAVVPVGGVPQQHGSGERSTRSVVLAQADPPQIAFPEAAEDVEYFDVKLENVTTRSGDRTRYWWRGAKVPAELESEVAHVIGFEALIKGEEDIAHHLLLYLCDKPLSPESITYVGEQSGGLSDDLQKCNFVNPIGSWAVGGKPVKLGADYGFPIGGAPERSTMLLEVHMDVPSEEAVTTNIGMRVYFTRKLRTYDAATLVLGANVDQFLLTPPKSESAHRYGYCYPGCTSAGLPEEGVNLVGGFLHMHTAGVAMETRHILANGTEVAPVQADDHYDFNLQAIQWLPEERKIMPGDSFITKCTYNTMDRTKYLTGGLSTYAEMCLHYVIVYPAPDMRLCISTGTPAFENALVQSDAFGGIRPMKDEPTSAFLDRVDNWDNFNPVFENLMTGNEKMLVDLCFAGSGDLLYRPEAIAPLKVSPGNEFVALPKVCPAKTTTKQPTGTELETTNQPDSTSVVASTPAVEEPDSPLVEADCGSVAGLSMVALMIALIA